MNLARVARLAVLVLLGTLTTREAFAVEHLNFREGMTITRREGRDCRPDRPTRSGEDRRHHRPRPRHRGPARAAVATPAVAGASAQAYATNPGTVLNAVAQTKLATAGQSFSQRTGKILTVTRGTATPAAQTALLLDAIRDDRAHGRPALAKYAPSEAKTMIVEAYDHARSPEEARAAIEKVLVDSIAANKAFSKHLDPNSAVADVRTKDLSPAEVALAIDALLEGGGHVLIESAPDRAAAFRELVADRYADRPVLVKLTKEGNEHLHVVFSPITREELEERGEVVREET